jgi:hypothetical protein
VCAMKTPLRFTLASIEEFCPMQRENPADRALKVPRGELGCCVAPPRAATPVDSPDGILAGVQDEDSELPQPEELPIW